MRVIGTAGHVDHGKSTLVAALTGTHPDRLKEEQAREMTIELGFAWLTLPDGEEVGIVDVPGHRDFIENMLAGVGGIDAALFVVAADEGVMPQTREHLAILDLLQISAGLIVLTKIDLIDDPDWLDMVESDVHSAVQGTVLQDAPVLRVSARAGTGIPALVEAMSILLKQRPPRPDLGRPRLPVDRVFSVAGFGTVVTGTLSDGRLALGDEVEVLPQGLRGRVRGLQSHKRKADQAAPGSRTAVNITGVDVDQVARGNVIVRPGTYRTTQRLDAQLRMLADASAPLHHNEEVKFFLGAAEMVARVRLLGLEELRPGETGWVQLELRDSLVAVRGDRYILRRPSPGETLGGGSVVDPQPARRHKRFAPQVIARLETLSRGTPAEVLNQAAIALGLSSLREVCVRARLSVEDAQTAMQELLQEGQWLLLESGTVSPTADLLVATLSIWQSETARALEEMARFHKAYPLRRGMPREQLKSRLRWTARVFNAAVRQWVKEQLFVENATWLALPTHQVRFNPQQQTQVERLLARFAAAPFSPPTVKEVQTEVGEEVYAALVELDQLIQVSNDVVFRKVDYNRALDVVQEMFSQEPTLTLAQFRDHFNTTRRYAQAFLEHLDAQGITQRDGDARRLRTRRT